MFPKGWKRWSRSWPESGRQWSRCRQVLCRPSRPSLMKWRG
ncbi:hypothetical protein BVRB_9g206420 [Beta vulgaris subsp. vulgaris]|uniref:Uncharacterized protein n=1 Tax=Beta vulgaris subsp. vulgaris TaxID=3555 RepID=A0A0J8BQK2_BETVV|nr:hypothetical protein BVRB_9g206420 [Beta vulgaris subsp. vulgaris]